MKLFILLLLAVLPAFCADMPWKYWMASVGVHAAGTSADAYSSWHQQENNQFLCNRQGQFGGRSVGLKVGVLAAITGSQLVILHVTHSRRAAKVFIVANSILGGGYGAIACRNMQMSGRN